MQSIPIVYQAHILACLTAMSGLLNHWHQDWPILMQTVCLGCTDGGLTWQRGRVMESCYMLMFMFFYAFALFLDKPKLLDTCFNMSVLIAIPNWWIRHRNRNNSSKMPCFRFCLHTYQRAMHWSHYATMWFFHLNWNRGWSIHHSSDSLS